MPVPRDDEQLDERTLVEHARQDADAFGELYRRHVDRIHRFAHRRTGSREEAEDVTAATFERALRGLQRYRWRPGGVAPWLYRIAANELADRHRARGRSLAPRAQRALGRHAVRPAHDELEQVDDQDAVAEVLAAMDTLRPRYQQVISLTYLTDLGAEEVAEAMGRSRATMAVTLHRALQALRRAVGER